MNHGTEVVLPVGHAWGTNALLPPMLWTSSVENSCSAPVLATAATQSLLSSTTSGASAPVSEDGRLEIFVALTSDRKSTRLNSSHANISYAVFCLQTKSDT